jgi:hypothetical protein
MPHEADDQRPHGGRRDMSDLAEFIDDDALLNAVLPPQENQRYTLVVAASFPRINLAWRKTLLRSRGAAKAIHDDKTVQWPAGYAIFLPAVVKDGIFRRVTGMQFDCIAFLGRRHFDPFVEQFLRSRLRPTGCASRRFAAATYD